MPGLYSRNSTYWHSIPARAHCACNRDAFACIDGDGVTTASTQRRRLNLDRCAPECYQRCRHNEN